MLMEALLNSILVPILAVDETGHILEMNQAAQQLLSANNATDNLDQFIPNFKEVLKISQPVRREVALTGGRIAEIHTAPLPDHRWAITIYDVSAYKRSERAKNNMLGEVAHDLKQPLASIASFSDMVEASGELNPRQQQYLARVRNAALRMTEQVLQLLDLAWIESGMKLTVVETDLVHLLRTAIDELESKAAAKRIRIELYVNGRIPSVMGDNRRLNQVMTNLISNAIKYSAEDTTVHCSIALKDKQIVVSVRDEGIGIAAEHIPHLFQQFYRVDSKQTRRIEGTGLGLFIARSIVEQHNGKISVESTPGAGSTFTVILPVHPFSS
jgi:signal transduction histidine kinase